MSFKESKLLNKIFDKIIKLIDFFISKNNHKLLLILKYNLLAIKTNVVFNSEGNWVIDWVGNTISKNLKQLDLLNIELASPTLVRNKIVHFGSVGCLITPQGLVHLKKSNKYVLTWFHIDDDTNRKKFIPFLNRRIEYLITSNSNTKKQLIKLGFIEKKIIIIPLGVDLSLFKCYDEAKKIRLRKKYELPLDKIIIGSFQKDGMGWGDGLQPKLIKGPDILCDVLKRLNEKFDIHVFLTGPSRGYVKKRLDQYDIPYTHTYFEKNLDLVDCYNVLDLYIIASRSEGGPLSLLETMATGVPLVATNVGMVPDLIKHEKNGFISEIENVNQIYQNAVKLLEDKIIREKFIVKNLEIVKAYNWVDLSKQYYYKVYKKLLK